MQKAAESAEAIAAHLECQQLLLQHASRTFHWNLRLGPPGPTVVIDIHNCTVQQVPVLASMVQVSTASSGGVTSSESSADSTRKRPRVDTPGENIATPQPGSHASPFDAPCTGCGLACMLLLLEGSATCMQLFCGPCGHRLASQTLSVRVCTCIATALPRNMHCRC